MATIMNWACLPLLQVGLCLCLLGEPGSSDAQTLPPGAVVRFGEPRLWHSSPRSTVFAAGGKMLASLGDDGEVRIWSVPSGVELLRFDTRKGPRDFARDLAASSCGKYLATAADKVISLREVGTARVLRTMTLRDGSTSLAFSPDGAVLAVLAADIVLFDVKTGHALALLETQAFRGGYLAFSSDGKTIAVGAMNRDFVELWDAATYKRKKRLALPKGWGVTCLAFAPGGRVLAGGCFGVGLVIHWDYESGQELRRLNVMDRPPPPQPDFGGATYIYALSFSPDGAILAAEGRLWRTDTWQQLPLPDIPAAQGRWVFSPDGATVAVLGLRQPVRLLERTKDNAYRPIGPQRAALIDAAWSPNGRSVVTADWELSHWDAGSGKLLHRFGRVLPIHPWSGLRPLHFSPDGALLAAVDDRAITLWDVTTRQSVRRLDKLKGKVLALSFSSDGRTVTAVEREDFADHPDQFFLHQWSTDGSCAHPPRRIRTDPDAVQPRRQVAASFSGDGRVLTLIDPLFRFQVIDMTARLQGHALAEEQQRSYAAANESDFACLAALSADGRTLAWTTRAEPTHSPTTVADLVLELRETAGGGRRTVLRLDRLVTPDSICLSPNGRLLAQGDGLTGLLILWDLTTGRELRRVRGHEGAITCLRFSPSGDRLLSGSEDTTALIWDVDRLLQEKPPKRESRRLQQHELAKCWDALAGGDAEVAYKAGWLLSEAPQDTVSFLGGKLHPTEKVAEDTVQEMIKNLGAKSAHTRRRAEQQLQEAGEQVSPALRRLLHSDVELEVRRRAEKVLKHLEEWFHSPNYLREYRAVEILERLGTIEAKLLLEKLAAGAREARLTLEAKASLARLRK